MRPSQRKLFWRSLARRLCSGLVLLCYFATSIGMPLCASSVKDYSQPFPCQDHACGCRTAAECWQQCCCFSPSEKLAWAQAHRVTPPVVAEDAGSGWQSERLRDQVEAEPHACCSASKKNQQAVEVARPCCSAKTNASACCQDSTSKTRPSNKLPGLRSLHCKGSTTIWLSGQTVTPPPALLTWNPNLIVTDRITAHNSLATSLSLLPLDPPPRPSAV